MVTICAWAQKSENGNFCGQNDSKSRNGEARKLEMEEAAEVNSGSLKCEYYYSKG